MEVLYARMMNVGVFLNYKRKGKMNKKQYVIMLKSRKIDIEKIFSKEDTLHREISAKIENYRKKFFELVSEYFWILDTLDLLRYRSLA